MTSRSNYDIVSRLLVKMSLFRVQRMMGNCGMAIDDGQYHGAVP